MLHRWAGARSGQMQSAVQDQHFWQGNNPHVVAMPIFENLRGYHALIHRDNQ